MLFSENGASRFVRLQGTFVDDEEIERVADYWRQRQKPNYLFTKEEITKQSSMNAVEDDLLEEVTYFVVRQGSASTSSIQRRFHIGYNRAARLMDMLEERGIVSEASVRNRGKSLCQRKLCMHFLNRLKSRAGSCENRHNLL